MEEHATRAEIAYHSRLVSARPVRTYNAPQVAVSMAGRSTSLCEPPIPASTVPSEESAHAADTSNSSKELCWHCGKAAAQLKVSCHCLITDGNRQIGLQSKKYMQPNSIISCKSYSDGSCQIIAVALVRMSPASRKMRAALRLD